MNASRKLLNQQEVKVLTECTKGTSLKAIAKKFGLNESEIYTISSGIKKKLNAKNMANAVYIAYR